MIIDALIIHNFGLFQGKHEIVMSPTSPSKPVVLIGGLNGRGKTTILDAIQLALYGKRAQCSNRGSLAYRDYLKRCVHRGENSSAVEIHLTTRIEGEDSSLVVRRSWTSASSTSDSLTVIRDNKRDERLEEGWDEYVEQLLPAGIAPLFFFDGEKIERLADPATSREILTTAINSLLGLDLIERLSSSLRTIERSKRKELDDDDDDGFLDRLEAKINELSGRVDGYQQDLADAKKNANAANKAAQEAENRFKKEGGELIQNRLLIEGEEKVLNGQIRSAKEQLVDLATGTSPLLLIEKLLGAVDEQARREAAGAANDSIQGLLAERDRDTLEFLESTGQLNSDRVGNLEEYLTKDRRKRDDAATVETFLEMPESARQFLNGFLTQEVPTLRKELKRSIEDEAELEEELRALEGRLDAIPPQEAVADLEVRRAESRKEALRADATLDVLMEQLRISKRELEQAAKDRAAAMEKDISDRFTNDSSRRVHEFSQRTRRVLNTFASELVRRNSERISALILDSFQQLLGKRELVGGIQLDVDLFDVTLTDPSGRLLAPEQLSAGERQLLAVAILWGLARLSGRALPSVIDTPLGRLDSTHRTNLVTSYFPMASHQVILLSTDEEISETYYSKIKASVGRSYLLTYNPETQSSSVQTGYFW